MMSLAVTSPPGVSSRRMIALTSGSAGRSFKPLEDAGYRVLLAGERARVPDRRDQPLDVDHQDLIPGRAGNEHDLLELLPAQEVEVDVGGTPRQGGRRGEQKEGHPFHGSSSEYRS